MTRKLDSVVQEKHIENIDLIKLDIQGSELDVLQGAELVLSQAEAVILEVQVLEYNVGAPKFMDVVRFMDEVGYEFNDILELHYLPTSELNEVDLLFLQKGSRLIKSGKMV